MILPGTIMSLDNVFPFKSNESKGLKGVLLKGIKWQLTGRPVY